MVSGNKTIETCYCRKCMLILPIKNFNDSSDNGLIDSNGKLSVCKNCLQLLYDEIFAETQSLEKAIHKMCMCLNIRYSNEAASATKAHITTLLESGKNVNAIFSIYKSKLTATKKSMDKSGKEYMGYDDVGTIYVSETINTKEIPIPKEVIDFWGKDITRREDIEFLESQYAQFKQSHRADTYAEIVLLKQICYTMLDIKMHRLAGDDTIKLVKELQDLMKNLAISPNVALANTQSKGDEAYGLWLVDIEKYEPAEWLRNDPRGDIYRDVANTDEYFQKYFVRPLKNFILMSKDFNLGDDSDDLTDDDSLLSTEETPDYKLLDDG